MNILYIPLFLASIIFAVEHIFAMSYKKTVTKEIYLPGGGKMVEQTTTYGHGHHHGHRSGYIQQRVEPPHPSQIVGVRYDVPVAATINPLTGGIRYHNAQVSMPIGQPSFGQPSFVQPSFGQPSFGQVSFGQPAFVTVNRMQPSMPGTHFMVPQSSSSRSTLAIASPSQPNFIPTSHSSHSSTHSSHSSHRPSSFDGGARANSSAPFSVKDNPHKFSSY